MTQPTKGYLLVASSHPNFYSLAINCAESILDYNPEAKITLFTEERFMDSRTDIFDNVFFCSDHYRSKLYGMANTPYDITFYIDVDSEIEHEDISNVFNCLGNSDLVFTPINKDNEYAYVSPYFNERKEDFYSFKLHGGFCLYDSRNPLVKDFMSDWWEYYQLQYADKWWPDDQETYPKHLKKWDQFTLWWLVNKVPKYKDLKINIFDDWARWNWACTYTDTRTHIDKPVIIRHMSSQVQKWGPELSTAGLADV